MLKPATVKALLEFRRERAWEQFHDPRNLAAAIAIEAGELQELFLWSKDSEVAQRALDRRDEISDEIADVIALLTDLCSDLNIDIDEAVLRKIAKNQEKYPVSQFRGSARKYNQR